MSKHFYQEYISEKTGKTIQNNLPSYCGKTPAVAFEPLVIEGWCENCYKIFEQQALGSIGQIIGKLSEKDQRQNNG